MGVIVAGFPGLPMQTLTTTQLDALLTNEVV